jgi:sugar/nucleoside kinase (ribokinase family)
MREVGFNLQYVQRAANASTLFSFCFYYPDGGGGNLTTDNSASAQVDAACINQALHAIEILGSAGIIMAAPEVPLNARYSLIELGKQHQLFCTGSFTSEEIVQAYNSGIIEHMDLLAINMDEAAALSGLDLEQTDPSFIVLEAIKRLQQKNKNILVSITGGKSGSWCWDSTSINHFMATDSKVKSTAGAGDAFFSGLLCGIATGLSFFEAQQLATLVAGLSVASPHTINKEICRQSLYDLIESSTYKLSPKILSLFKQIELWEL